MGLISTEVTKARRFRSPFRRPDSQSSEARTCGHWLAGPRLIEMDLSQWIGLWQKYLVLVMLLQLQLVSVGFLPVCPRR